ncbi:MAG: hypothetical protein JWQ49_1819 [Edaphobacter sp.]|jgi:hypothetical protein|nr:hypothetical protein [Edaphobacter sp.]
MRLVRLPLPGASRIPLAAIAALKPAPDDLALDIQYLSQEFYFRCHCAR